MATQRGRGIGFFRGGARAIAEAERKAKQEAEDAKILLEASLIEESEALQNEKRILIERGKMFYPNFVEEFKNLDTVSILTQQAKRRSVLMLENWTQNKEAVEKRNQREIQRQNNLQIIDLSDTSLHRDFFDVLPPVEYNSLNLVANESILTWYNRVTTANMNHYQFNVTQQLNFVYNEVHYQRRKEKYLDEFKHLSNIRTTKDYNFKAKKFIDMMNEVSRKLDEFKLLSFSKIKSIHFDNYSKRRTLYWKNRHKFFDLNELFRLEPNNLYFFLKYHNLTGNKQKCLETFCNYLFYKYFHYFSGRILLISKNFIIPHSYDDNQMIPIKYKFNRSLLIHIDNHVTRDHHLYKQGTKELPLALQKQFKHIKRIITFEDNVFDVVMAYHYFLFNNG